MNYSYEINAGCTVIICKDKNDYIIHGRNFDYDNPELYSKIAATADFYKNGSILFKSAILAGLIGSHQILKNDHFGISLNERDEGNKFLKTMYYIFLRKTEPIPYLLH